MLLSLLLAAFALPGCGKKGCHKKGPKSEIERPMKKQKKQKVQKKHQKQVKKEAPKSKSWFK